jgi:hypothetical protein
MARKPKVLAPPVEENEETTQTTETTQVNASVTTTSDDGGGGYSDSNPSKTVKFEMKAVKGSDTVVNEVWFKTLYRPAIAWGYFLMLMFDFIIAPVLTMILPKFITGATYIPWHPLTLEGGGLVHVALGVIIGVTAWGRTKEKIANVGGD